MNVRIDPVRQLLGPGRLGVGEVAGAEHRDEQLDRPQLTRAPVDQAGPLAREVDEGLLASPVDLSHRRPQPLDPVPVQLAKLGVAVAVRIDLDALLPEQLQRDAVAFQFAVDVRAVGPRSEAVPHRLAATKQPGLERRVVQLGRQRPAEPARSRLLQIPRNRSCADNAGQSYFPVRQSLLMLEPKDFPNLPHQQLYGRLPDGKLGFGVSRNRLHFYIRPVRAGLLLLAPMESADPRLIPPEGFSPLLLIQAWRIEV